MPCASSRRLSVINLEAAPLEPDPLEESAPVRSVLPLLPEMRVSGSFLISSGTCSR